MLKLSNKDRASGIEMKTLPKIFQPNNCLLKNAFQGKSYYQNKNGKGIVNREGAHRCPETWTIALVSDSLVVITVDTVTV